MLNPNDLSKLAGKLGGLPVLGCRPGSPAARAGIRYGDIVLAINGQPTPDWSAYLAARALRPDDMTVEVFRAGETVTHHLVLDRNAQLDPWAVLAEVLEQGIGGPSALPGAGAGTIDEPS